MELKNSSLFKEKGFINGKWVSAENGKTYDVTNPADNSLVAKVPSMGKTETIFYDFFYWLIIFCRMGCSQANRSFEV